MKNLVILNWISNKQSQQYIYIYIYIYIYNYYFTGSFVCLLWKIFYFEEDLELQVFYSAFTVYVLAEILDRYHPLHKLEGRGFDSWWCHWTFSLT